MSELFMTIVVADASGSMREQGKTALIRNLITHVREQARLGGEPAWRGPLVVVRWSSTAEVVPVTPDEDLPSWSVEGQTRAVPLLPLLDSLCPGDAPARVLLLSDGHMASGDVTAFNAWRRRRQGVSMRALAVGPDAVPATLAKITGPDGVFRAEEIVAALASWTILEKPPLPESLAEVAGAMPAAAR